MAIEAAEGLKRAERLGNKYLMAYWNPMGIVIKAKGMLGYLTERLPNDIDKAVETITRRSSGCP